MNILINKGDMETELQKCVTKCKVDGIENAYISISAQWRNKAHDGISKIMAFCYIASDNIIIEWEPEYGPITVIYKCDKDHEQAEPHWYFDYCTGNGNWSQLAVDENRLHESYVNGDYKQIFNVLKRFS